MWGGENYYQKNSEFISLNHKKKNYVFQNEMRKEKD
jgi:hypothetical protein